MTRRSPIFYSASQKALMWERWRAGDALHQIAQLFDRSHSSIQRILGETGGIRPPVRRRSKLALTLAEREEISRCLVAGLSIRAMAGQIGSAASTVSREINRNGGPANYRTTQADVEAWRRAHRPKRCKLVERPALARIVTAKLQKQWSPEQIAGRLKHTHCGDPDLYVSHETIYRSLYIQARGALKRELLQHLRRTRGMRRSRHHTQKTPDHGRIIDTISIRERPASVEDRAVPGHWEGDLLFGDRTRYVMLVKVGATDTETVVSALIKHARPFTSVFSCSSPEKRSVNGCA